jgi:natural product precursor
MGNLAVILFPQPRRPDDKQSKRLTLSMETLRSLDDRDLTDVVGGSNSGGGGENNNSFVCSIVCVSYQCYIDVL